MAAYDNRYFEPPAPVVSAALRNPESRTTLTDVHFLIDSGADVTLVPQYAITSLDVTPSESQYELMGFDGRTSLAHIVNLELLIAGRTFRGQFLITQDEIGILGRNILNTLAIVLDGPRQEWYELKRA